MIMDQLGLTRADFEPIARAVVGDNDLQTAKAMVTEPMMRIGIAGTARDLIVRLETLVGQGAKHLSFGPPLGPDIDEAVRVIGRDVIPYFRA
jgi:5,10-methylenetetrahydromethanopterin reductase